VVCRGEARPDEWETAALARLIEQRRAEAVPRQPATERPIVERLQTRQLAEDLPRFSELHEDQVAAAERLVSEISQRVRDSELRRAPCVRVAWAVVEGRLPRDRLYRILDRLDVLQREGKLCCDRGAYFVKSVQGAFRDLGLEWAGKPRKPR
jgi:hypothetical protein